MNHESIIIISFGQLRQELLGTISADVMIKFPIPVKTRTEYLDLSEFYDPGRRQYNGMALLKMIDNEFASAPSKTIGLFTVDLFIPILTFIFGQAFLNGRSGIASIFRLSNERYGVKKDDKILHERFSKEVIHELGHMFGLIHCSDPYCIMRSSTYVEDIDQKGGEFCSNCRNSLNLNL
jgi:archaemetzincin